MATNTSDSFKDELVEYRNAYLPYICGKTPDSDKMEYADHDKFQYLGFLDALKEHGLNREHYYNSVKFYGWKDNNPYLTGFEKTGRLISSFIQSGVNPEELAKLIFEYKHKCIRVYENDNEYKNTLDNLRNLYDANQYCDKTIVKVGELKERTKTVRKCISDETKQVKEVLISDLICIIHCTVDMEASRKKCYEIEYKRFRRIWDGYRSLHKDDRRKLINVNASCFRAMCRYIFTLEGGFYRVFYKYKDILYKASNTLSDLGINGICLARLKEMDNEEEEMSTKMYDYEVEKSKKMEIDVFDEEELWLKEMFKETN